MYPSTPVIDIWGRGEEKEISGLEVYIGVWE
jgi:hypothetical protein